MRKYLFIYQAEVMSSLQYLSNILIHAISYFIVIFIFFNLWDYVYDDPSQLINGYSKSQMIWYVIITEIIWYSNGGRKLCRKICDDVKSGNIAYNMNKPYSYVGYILSNQLGDVTIKGLIYLTIGIVLGTFFLKSFPMITVIEGILVMLSIILAIIIDSLFVTFIGLISLFIEDANPLYWLYSKLLLVLGTMFPVEFFPKLIQGIIKWSPVHAICYGPAKMFVDFHAANAISIILVQLIYLIIAYALCEFVYQKGVKKLNVNGG